MQEQTASQLQLPVNWGRLWDLHRASLTPQQIAAVQQGNYYVSETPSSSAECCLTVAPQLVQSCSIATDADGVSMLLKGPAEQQPVVTRQSVRVSLAPVVTTAVMLLRDRISPQLPVSVPAGTPAPAWTAGGASQMHGQHTNPFLGQAAVQPGRAALPAAVAHAQLEGFGAACRQQGAAGPRNATYKVPLHPVKCCDHCSSPAAAGDGSPAAAPSISRKQHTQLCGALMDQEQSSRQASASATVPELDAAETGPGLDSYLSDELELQQLLLAMADDMPQPNVNEQLVALGLVAQP